MNSVIFRNAVINTFRPIELRNDLGARWENFVVMRDHFMAVPHRIHGMVIRRPSAFQIVVPWQSGWEILSSRNVPA